jgi:hypothetical protein
VARVAGAVLAAIVAALAPAALRAEHRVEYRYAVVGYVTDAAGRPLVERTVQVIRDRTGFSYLAETDRRGLFVAVVRLGDESAGETLTVRAGQSSIRIVARFDPANHRDERGTQVDLEGARFTERPAAFPRTLAEIRGVPGR